MSTRSRASIMLVEDHPMIRDVHARLLTEALPHARFINCDTTEAALDEASGQFSPDLILLNYDMAGGPALNGFRALRSRFEGVPVVLVDAPEEARRTLDALGAGAAGYMSKSMRAEGLVQALLLVLAGETFVPAFAFAETRARYDDPLLIGRMSDDSIASLSPRRRQILSMVAAGAPNKVIARALSVHEVTVKSHLRVIFKTLGVTTRTQAARLAMYSGMGVDDPLLLTGRVPVSGGGGLH